MSYGESIGKLYKSASPYHDTLNSYKKVVAADFISNLTISSVLAGTDHSHLVTIEASDGSVDLFTEPPITDAEEAYRISKAIEEQIDLGVKQYQQKFKTKIQPTEMDRFEATPKPKTSE